MQFDGFREQDVVFQVDVLVSICFERPEAIEKRQVSFTGEELPKFCDSQLRARHLMLYTTCHVSA